ncbi:MAG: hypothetical protein LH650_04640 [Chloroflexi bacterium]|nr:hypothetical protein [Chloroflexota bacterium]
MIARRVTPVRMPVLAAVAGLIVVEGLSAARVGFAAFSFGAAFLALVAGWMVAGCGLVAWHRVPQSRVGVLLVVTGAATFFGSFKFVDADVIARIATSLTWLYVAVIGQAVLTAPTGRPTRHLDAALVVALYVLALLPLPSPASIFAVGLAAALVIQRVAVGNPRPRWAADIAGVVVVVGFAAGSIESVGVLNVMAVSQLALVVAALILAADVMRITTTPSGVTDLVLRLDPAGPTNLAGELRLATGDASLEVGYWLPERLGFVDAVGRSLTLPAEGSGRSVTPVLRDGQRIAVLIHDLTLEAGTTLPAAVARAVELATANARLQAELRAQVVDVRASRRRIVDAVQEERRAVGQRLGGRLLQRLDRLDTELTEMDDDEAVARVRMELLAVRHELARLADGLFPGALEERGLESALHDLMHRSPLTVRLDTDDMSGLPLTTAAALYFVCSEALTNVAKHAQAGTATVTLRSDARQAHLDVLDDGVGGADPAAGTGLRGIRDRVEALGGTLQLTSAQGAGTHLRVSIPTGSTA